MAFAVVMLTIAVGINAGQYTGYMVRNEKGEGIHNNSIHINDCLFKKTENVKSPKHCNTLLDAPNYVICDKYNSN